jgi:hypothetical protein
MKPWIAGLASPDVKQLSMGRSGGAEKHGPSAGQLADDAIDSVAAK